MGIGEFARLSRLSSHALRRYDEMGLLPPCRVDPDSGYRWYSAEQLGQARLVAAARQIGMPLAQVKLLLGLSRSAAAAHVAQWWADAETDHAARRELAGFLVGDLKGERFVMYEVNVRSVPERSVLCLLRHLRWDEFPATARDFTGRFAGVPRPPGTDGSMFIVYHGEVSEDSDGPVEFCRPVSPSDAASLAERFPDLVLRTEAAHEEAFVHLARDPGQTPPAQSLLVLETLLTWASSHNRRPGGSVRQVFVGSAWSGAGARDGANAEGRATAEGGSGAPGGFECDFAVPLAAESAVSSGAVVGLGAVVSPEVVTEPGTTESTRPTVSSGFAAVADADLYYERRGDGPALLLITGGGDDSEYYSGLADVLASSYTVMTYDRRGNSRSRLHGAPVPIDMAAQSADAVAVLKECGFSSAVVFGNSGGATIALDLAVRYPSVVSVIVAHEPPLPLALADPAPVMATFDDISRVLAEQGWQPAFRLFQTRVARLSPEEAAWLLDPGPGPGVPLETMRRVSRNWEYLIRYEMRSFVDYLPDFGALRASQARIVLAAGAGNSDPLRREVSLAVAEQANAEFAEFPGGHNGPLDLPAAFAARLREVLAPS
jgi:pimeloyl-ACP methyl ester carboxylesterase/DNA-binding transcriptional MerR regulator